jgi:hypothetical protein
MKQINLSDYIKGFTTKWIISNSNNEIFLVSNNSIIKYNDEKLSDYSYLGNLDLEEKPYFDNLNRLIVSTGGYTSIFDKIIFTNNKTSPEYYDIDVPNSILESQPISIKVNTDNYFEENFSIKKVEIVQDEKIVHEVYTPDKELIIQSSFLKKGDYLIRVYVKGDLIISKKLIVKIPFERNPLFYLLISSFCIIILLFYFFIIYNKKIHKKRILSNKLEMLHKNLNPHFIFNSLNLIYNSILEENKDKALLVLRDFSKVQRNFIDRSKEEKVSLLSEIDFIKSYLAIERYRYQDDTKVVLKEIIDSSIPLNNVYVPPNILQPIVENALKYGILEYKGNENKEIILVLEKINKLILLSIENPKNHNEDNMEIRGVHNLGLSIVKERIHLFNQEMNTDIKFLCDLPANKFNYGYRVELIIKQNT